MRKPIFVRAVTDAEREQLEAALRSSDAFVPRRCQIILAIPKGQRAPHIASNLGCDDETVRRVIRAFNEHGLACLKEGSRVPHTVHPAFDVEKAEGLRAKLRRARAPSGSQPAYGRCRWQPR